MKYLYTPNDLAIYFLISDFTISEEKRVLDNLWEQQNSKIWSNYRSNKKHFRSSIYNEISKYDGTLDNLDELNLILQDVDSSLNIDGSINEQEAIERFFKIIKLQLTYTFGMKYRKIKFRNIIRRFGYKRRTMQLVENIERTIRCLELVANLRDYAPCEIAAVKLDDTVIIRLKH